MPESCFVIGALLEVVASGRLRLVRLTSRHAKLPKFPVLVVPLVLFSIKYARHGRGRRPFLWSVGRLGGFM